jgi:hypothetical protein
MICAKSNRTPLAEILPPAKQSRAMDFKSSSSPGTEKVTLQTAMHFGLSPSKNIGSFDDIFSREDTWSIATKGIVLCVPIERISVEIKITFIKIKQTTSASVNAIAPEIMISQYIPSEKNIEVTHIEIPGVNLILLCFVFEIHFWHYLYFRFSKY